MSDEANLPFKVYCLRSSGGNKLERQFLASFARYIEAEVFVHAGLRGSFHRGMDAGRYWGDDGISRSVHYWIESPQQVASVRRARDSASSDSPEA